MPPKVEFKNISKFFGPVQVLKDVSFCIDSGEFHALIGENGAGKSTLLNILHGVYSQYEGSVEIDGNPQHFKNISDSIHAGVAKVHQELHIVKNLNVGQNIFLGYEPLQKNKCFISEKDLFFQAEKILKKLGSKLSPKDSIEHLSVGELQMIAIAKALFHGASLISFDEPTASLSKQESDRLFEVIEDLKSQGITIIYISHRMEEIFKFADKVTILRDGSHVLTAEKSGIAPKAMIEHMIGKNVEAFAVRSQPYCPREEVLLEVKNLSRKDCFENISFQLHRGEILGFSGLVGAKRTEVMRSIFGADSPEGLSGDIILKGEKIAPKNPREASRLKIGFISENRKTEGFVKNTSNYDNIALPSLSMFSKAGFINKKQKEETADQYIRHVQLSPPRGDMHTSALSGGNQQKVILAKWLASKPDLLILDEPTKGIDISAKAQIYALLEDLAASGIGIIMVSSEMQEIVGLCDRALVMYEGRQIALVDHKDKEFNQENLLTYAFGG